MWAPRQPEPPPLGWWVELSRNRWIAGVAADMRERRQVAEQDKRRRQLRRRVERINEQMVLAEGASEARRHLARKGIRNERSDGLGPIEHSAALGRVLSVR